MRNFFKSIYERSVFSGPKPPVHVNEIFVQYTHRACTILYMLYALWAVGSTLTGIPSLVAANGEFWQVIFTIVVGITTILASFGSAFFPALARLELFAASSFAGLIALYIFFLLASGVPPQNDALHYVASAILISTILVMPVARVYFILRTLLRQAKGRK